MILPDKNKTIVEREVIEKRDDSVGAPGAPADPGVETSGANALTKMLTPEEQMALFEKELKDNDWGHQPC
jgi:hypothetical protein